MIDNPSWQHFATHDESEHPELWRGVRAYWAPCLGPSGTRLHDVSGLSNWGTFNNMDPPTDWVVDSGRYAIDLDGSNDFIDMGDRAAFEPTLLTLSAWIKPTTTNQTAFSTIAGKAWSTTHTNPFFSYKFGSNYSSNASGPYSLEVTIGGAIRTVIGTFGPSGGRLDYLCGTYDGATMRLYINGVLNASASFAGSIGYSTGSFRMGANANGAELFNGRIFDCIIHDRVLSASEVWQLYQIGRGGMLTPRRRHRAYFAGSGLRRRLLLTGQV